MSRCHWWFKHRWVFLGEFWCRTGTQEYWTKKWQCKRCKSIELGEIQ